MKLQARAVRFNDPLPRATLHLGDRRVGRALGMAEYRRRRQIANDYETAWGRFQASSHILDVLDDLAERISTPTEITFSVRAIYNGWQAAASKRIEGTAAHFPAFVNLMQERLSDRLAAQAESEIIENQARDGSMPAKKADAATRELARTIRGLRGGIVRPPEIDATEALRKTVFFMEIPEDDLVLLAKVLRPCCIPDYEEILGAKPNDGSMFVVASGVVQGSATEDGKARVVETWGAGEIFGDTEILGRSKEAAQYRAMTPRFLYGLKVADLERISRSIPAIRSALQAARPGTLPDAH